jgi:hypothetical protein
MSKLPITKTRDGKGGEEIEKARYMRGTATGTK